MGEQNPPRGPRLADDRDDAPGMPRRPRLGWVGGLVVAALAVGLGYGLYVWELVRVVVPPNHVLVLLKKNGTRSLPGDEVIIPRTPADAADPSHAAWAERYADCNGILEEVYPEGTYFQFSPFDYEREVLDVSDTAIVPNGKVGVVVRKFGARLDPGQVLADPARHQRGPLPIVLQPGRYNEYANPYAYELKHVDPVSVNPGERGVVALLAAPPSRPPNQFLVDDGTQGVQRETEPEGFRYINPYAKRVVPISVRSQRYEMIGADAIRFPSSDSFDIQMEGFVEWSVLPDHLPLTYVQYGEASELIPVLQEKVILPYARSFCRLVGSRYNARDFISGDTKLKFQQEFESSLREACLRQGIRIEQALVRDVVPPKEIKDPINEREIAKQTIKTLEQQIQVAKSQAELATQEQMATQNQKVGEANKEVVGIIKQAEQVRDVAVTRARQRLEVARLQLEAASKQAEAQVARGRAEAAVILLNHQAEAEPLRRQVSAFGDGQAYAQYFFYQKISPAVKSILASTDGPFGQMFRELSGSAAPATTAHPEVKP